MNTQGITAQERCDRCGAQAYVVARLLSGHDLAFCAHHARRVEAALKPQTIRWVDESDRLDVAAATR